MADKYSNYAELAAAEEEGIDFEVVVVKREPPRVVVIAPHAGGIEPKTGPIAREIVGAEFSLYCFRGMKNAGKKIFTSPVIISTNLGASTSSRTTNG